MGERLSPLPSSAPPPAARPAHTRLAPPRRWLNAAVARLRRLRGAEHRAGPLSCGGPKLARWQRRCRSRGRDQDSPSGCSRGTYCCCGSARCSRRRCPGERGRARPDRPPAGATCRPGSAARRPLRSPGTRLVPGARAGAPRAAPAGAGRPLGRRSGAGRGAVAGTGSARASAGASPGAGAGARVGIPPPRLASRVPRPRAGAARALLRRPGTLLPPVPGEQGRRVAGRAGARQSPRCSACPCQAAAGSWSTSCFVPTDSAEALGQLWWSSGPGRGRPICHPLSVGPAHQVSHWPPVGGEATGKGDNRVLGANNKNKLGWECNSAKQGHPAERTGQCPLALRGVSPRTQEGKGVFGSQGEAGSREGSVCFLFALVFKPS